MAKYTCFPCLGGDHRRCERIDCVCNLCGKGIRKRQAPKPREPKPSTPRSDRGVPRPHGPGTGRDKPGRKPDLEKYEQIRELVDRGGKSLREIGRIVGMDPKTVGNVIRKLGLVNNPKAFRRDDSFTEAEEEQARDLREHGMSYNAIAEKMGRSSSGVYRAVNGREGTR